MSQMFEKNLLIPCLLDVYGCLLSDRKRELLDFYYGEDYSLSEISELTGISRQGIRDSIKKSSAELLELEDRLKLYEKKISVSKLISEARATAEKLRTDENAAEISSLITRLDTIEDLL